MAEASAGENLKFTNNVADGFQQNVGTAQFFDPVYK